MKFSLLFAVAMLLAGAGLQATLLSLRAGVEDFPIVAMGLVVSGYYAGYIVGSKVCGPPPGPSFANGSAPAPQQRGRASAGSASFFAFRRQFDLQYDRDRQLQTQNATPSFTVAASSRVTSSRPNSRPSKRKYRAAAPT